MIIIEQDPGSGLYNRTNLTALLDAVAVVINARPAGKNVVKQGAVNPRLQVLAPDHYRYASLAALADLMTQATWNPPPIANQPDPDLQFDNAHGMLHFNGSPTKQKSKWSETQAAASTRMEAEIKKHLNRMRRESKVPPHGNQWEAWYIGQQAEGNIGKYNSDARGGSDTDLYTIQLQVNWITNKASYHGFPDERLAQRKLGCGRVKNNLDCNC